VREAPLAAFVETPFVAGEPYRSIEIQQLKLKGQDVVIVARHRSTGELDVFAPSTAQLDREWFVTDPFMAHMPFGSVSTTSFRVSRFEVGPRAVDVEVDFDDNDGRQVHVRVRHTFRRSGRPWFVPAVPGQSDPATFRFMLAQQIRLLPRSVKTLEASVDGQRLEPRPFLLPGRVAPFYSARVSSGVLGVGLNQTGQTEVDTSASAERHRVERGTAWFDFRLEGLGTADSGRFHVESSVGPVAEGRWMSHTDGDLVSLQLNDVYQDWFPGLQSPSRLALYGLRKARRRGERWSWHGTCNAVDGEATLVEGRWESSG
jgi:hypothetical protein